MLRRPLPHLNSSIGALLGMLFTISIQAAPVSFTPYFFRTHIMHSDRNTENLLAIGANSVTPMQNTSATATQGAMNVALTTFGASELGVRLPYNPDQVGSWTITAINGPDTTTHVTNDVAGVQALPFVSNINLSGSLLAPILTWVLPVTSVPYTRIRIRIQAGGAIVFTSNFLPVNTTTYTLPSGVLQLDRDYILRIMLEEGRNGNLVNRSDVLVAYMTLANLLAGLTSTGQIYYTLDLNTWVNIPGQLAQLQVGHFNGDGQADLAGLANNGSIWYTTDLSTWTQVPGGLAQLRVGDFNGDGQADLAGLASNGSIWYTTDLSTWTQIPGALAQLRVGDLNGDGQADLAGLASNGSIWYTTDLSTWTQVPGGLAQLRTSDFNGDGHADLAGLASNGSIWYTTNLTTWTQVSGQLAQLQVGDLNGDGHADLVGLASNGSIWYTTNRTSWTQVPGALNRLVVRDLNGDGQADLAGLASNGSIWYTTNLTTWTQIPGQLNRLAGDD